MQKMMSQRSAGSCTRCTRANAFPAWFPNYFDPDQNMFVTIWKLLFCLIQNNMVPILKPCSGKNELLTTLIID